MNKEQETMISMARDGMMKLPESGEELAKILSAFYGLNKTSELMAIDVLSKMKKTALNVIFTKSKMSDDGMAYLSSIKDALYQRKSYSRWFNLKLSEGVDGFDSLINDLADSGKVIVSGNKITLSIRVE